MNLLKNKLILKEVIINNQLHINTAKQNYEIKTKINEDFLIKVN